MSAGDIPEHGHDGGLAMARVLVTYMDDPDMIYRAIKLEHEIVPCHATIRKLRAHYLRQVEYARTQYPDAQPCDAYKPAAAREALDATNKRFLLALELERDRSVPPLRSPYLTAPVLVDARWDEAFAVPLASDREAA